MFSRRSFQPTLEQMPFRIVPSALAATALVGSASAATTVADTEMPQTGHSSPMILAPATATQSGTVLC